MICIVDYGSKFLIKNWLLLVINIINIKSSEIRDYRKLIGSAPMFGSFMHRISKI